MVQSDQVIKIVTLVSILTHYDDIILLMLNKHVAFYIDLHQCNITKNLYHDKLAFHHVNPMKIA